jgi:hypothetical protein
MLTTAGRRVFARMALGEPVALALGVGGGTAPEDLNDAFLAGETNSGAHYMPLDPGFPLHEDGAVVLQATFPPNAALFHWTEWGLAAGSSPLREATAIRGAGEDAVLAARLVPDVPLHSEPKDESRAWTLRVAIKFT